MDNFNITGCTSNFQVTYTQYQCFCIFTYVSQSVKFGGFFGGGGGGEVTVAIYPGRFKSIKWIWLCHIITYINKKITKLILCNTCVLFVYRTGVENQISSRSVQSSKVSYNILLAFQFQSYILSILRHDIVKKYQAAFFNMHIIASLLINAQTDLTAMRFHVPFKTSLDHGMQGHLISRSHL